MSSRISIRISIVFYEGIAVSRIRNNRMDIVFFDKADEPGKTVCFCNNKSCEDLLAILKKVNKKRNKYKSISFYVVDSPLDTIVAKLISKNIEFVDERAGSNLEEQ